MRVRINIGIDPQCDRRAFPFVAGDLVDVVQFRLALHVEAEDVLIERILDFLLRFSDSGESSFGVIASGIHNPKQLATGDDVESRSSLCQQF